MTLIINKMLAANKILVVNKMLNLVLNLVANLANLKKRARKKNIPWEIRAKPIIPESISTTEIWSITQQQYLN